MAVADTRPTTDLATSSRTLTRAVPALVTLALGVTLLFCVGFLQTPAVHNGAHDTRHANGFPCH